MIPSLVIVFCELYTCICYIEQIWTSLKEVHKKFCCRCGGGYVSVVVIQ